MARYRTHSVASERQVVRVHLAGVTLRGLTLGHAHSRNLIRGWGAKQEAGALDEEVQTADLLLQPAVLLASAPSSCPGMSAPRSGAASAPPAPRSYSALTACPTFSVLADALNQFGPKPTRLVTMNLTLPTCLAVG